MNTRIPYSKKTGISVALTLAILSVIADPGRATARQSCVIEDNLPTAYAELQQPGLHQPPELWPEAVRGADGKPTPSSAPTVATHGQLLLGRESLYLYHLPMFMRDPGRQPHNFQVVLETEFADAGGAAHGQYLSDRKENPGSIYTAVPPPFGQTALVLDYPGHPRLGKFDGVAVVRDHFERGGKQILIAPMKLHRMVHFRGLTPDQPKPADLSYVLFGRGGDLFLAHMLSAPPDFDQILEVTVENASLPTDAAENGLFVTLTSRGNSVGERLRTGEVITCSSNGQTIPLRVAAETYCEVGETERVGGGRPRDCPSL